MGKKTKKSIIKSNKEIAIFMGGKIEYEKYIWLPKHGMCRYDTINVGNGRILKYHESWDWLIPVINKIIDDEFYFKYVYFSSNVFFDGGIKVNTRFINRTYDQVVDFLEWKRTGRRNDE